MSDACGRGISGNISWEPVGNTTRDYLDNPRLIPEDTPNPSVIAPEAPAYETLESFRSGETDVSLPVPVDGDLPRNGSFVFGMRRWRCTCRAVVRACTVRSR